MEEIHAKRFWKDIETKKLGKHDVYIQTDTLLIADIFESFRNKCLEI